MASSSPLTELRTQTDKILLCAQFSYLAYDRNKAAEAVPDFLTKQNRLHGVRGYAGQNHAGQDHVEPSNDEQSNDEPSNDEPGNDEPGNDEPGNDEPGNDEPGNDEPGNDEPGNDEPDRGGQNHAKPDHTEIDQAELNSATRDHAEVDNTGQYYAELDHLEQAHAESNPTKQNHAEGELHPFTSHSFWQSFFLGSHAFVYNYFDHKDSVNRIVVAFRGTKLTEDPSPTSLPWYWWWYRCYRWVYHKCRALPYSDVGFDATLIRIPYTEGTVWKWYALWGSLILERTRVSCLTGLFGGARTVAAALISSPNHDRIGTSNSCHKSGEDHGDVHLGFWALWASPEGFAGYDRHSKLWGDLGYKPKSKHSKDPNTSGILTCVRDKLKAADGKKTEIMIAGHSLGGAVSCFAALDIHRHLRKWHNDDNIDTTGVSIFHATFGMPPVGDRDFQKYFNTHFNTHFNQPTVNPNSTISNKCESWSIYHQYDIVADCFAWCGTQGLVSWLGWWGDWRGVGNRIRLSGRLDNGLRATTPASGPPRANGPDDVDAPADANAPVDANGPDHVDAPADANAPVDARVSADVDALIDVDDFANANAQINGNSVSDLGPAEEPASNDPALISTPNNPSIGVVPHEPPPARRSWMVRIGKTIKSVVTRSVNWIGNATWYLLVRVVVILGVGTPLVIIYVISWICTIAAWWYSPFHLSMREKWPLGLSKQDITEPEWDWGLRDITHDTCLFPAELQVRYHSMQEVYVGLIERDRFQRETSG